jgi:hypothetical protein
MRTHHIAGAVAAAALIAITGPAGIAHAEAGTFHYDTQAGGADKVDLPEPYRCYAVGDAEEPVIGGHNQTVFTARLYVDGMCNYPLPRDIAPGAGFETRGAGGVKFFPAA